MKMLLEGPEDEAKLELVALCINLAINKRNAQIMVEDNRLGSLMARAFRNQDSLIMKMIRNIAMHEGTKQNFVVSFIFHNSQSCLNVNWLHEQVMSGVLCTDINKCLHFCYICTVLKMVYSDFIDIV
jgi:hypothetical protein